MVITLLAISARDVRLLVRDPVYLLKLPTFFLQENLQGQVCWSHPDLLWFESNMSIEQTHDTQPHAFVYHEICS